MTNNFLTFFVKWIFVQMKFCLSVVFNELQIATKCKIRTTNEKSTEQKNVGDSIKQE